MGSRGQQAIGCFRLEGKVGTEGGMLLTPCPKTGGLAGDWRQNVSFLQLVGVRTGWSC